MTIGAIIPVKNEYGNIESMVISANKIKQLNQVVFIDGNSSDNTFDFLMECIQKYGNREMSVVMQNPPYNKFEAIKQARKKLNTEHILIWDGDNTIPSNDVEKIIYTYLSKSRTSNVFVMANRLTKYREKKSFRFINLAGNYIFSVIMRPILGSWAKDVLSGVKIFPYFLFNNENCDKILTSDHFGDIALLSFARKRNLIFISVPCNYKIRSYGSSSIARWSGGLILLKSILHLYSHRCFKSS